MKITNAKIHSTMLGFEDHGIFTYFIYLSYGESASQGFGGYALSGSHPVDQKMYSKQYCAKVIEGLLKTVGVDKWEDLPGKYVRVESDDTGKLTRIGNILEDEWFDPKNV